MVEESEIITAITALGQVDHVETDGNHFFFFDPGPPLGTDRRLPFATLVTTDAYDRASNLDRPGVYRLNLGVKPDTYRRLFGAPPAATREMNVVDTGHDYTRLGELMPHPVYAPLSWVCVLNPGPETFGAVRPLLEEAYRIAARRAETRANRPPPGDTGD